MRTAVGHPLRCWRRVSTVGKFPWRRASRVKAIALAHRLRLRLIQNDVTIPVDAESTTAPGGNCSASPCTATVIHARKSAVTLDKNGQAVADGKRWVTGEIFGLPIPADAEALRSSGCEFLTTALDRQSTRLNSSQ